MTLTKRLRTTIVQPSGVVGGAELYLLALLDATDRLDPDVVLLQDGPLRHELAARGIPHRVMPVGRRARHVAAAALRVRRLLAASPPDVLVANGVKAAAVGLPAAAAAGVRTAWIKHDVSHDKRLARTLSRLAGCVIATSQSSAGALSPDQVVVIEPPRPDGNPLPREAARLALAAEGVPANDLWLGMAGRLVPYKGIDVAIRALTDVRTGQWRLVVLGIDDPSAPDERSRLHMLAASLGVADRVHLLPARPSAWTLFSALDALAVLTAGRGCGPAHEGFGLVAIEAGLCRVPVLAPDDRSEVASRLRRDRSGVLISPGGDAVADALHVLRDESMRRRLGEAARQAAASHWRATEMADALVDELADVARRPGAGRALGPSISVVCPVLNEFGVIDDLVGPLLAQLREGDELIVVDGGSADGTRARLDLWRQRSSAIRIVLGTPGSAGRSRNEGIRSATNDAIACTDAGCRPDQSWLDGMRAGLATAHRGGLLIGGYRAGIRPGRLFQSAMAAVAWPDLEELRRPTPLRRAWTRVFGRRFDERRVDTKSVAFTKQVWSLVGGFPESLPAAEDVEFGRSAREKGVQVRVTSDACVLWWQREGVKATAQQFRRYGRGGGAAQSPLLLMRDSMRVAAYLAAGLVVARGRQAECLALAVGVGAFLSLPFQRLFRRGEPLGAYIIVPFAAVIKDVSKVIGAAEGLIGGLGRRRS